MAIPSYVLVPLPISSRMTSERGVAWFRMAAVSTISTMKVDWPVVRSSCSPARVKIRSTTPMLADSAGTKLPVCAMRTITAAWRMYVDLPAMLGPVSRMMRDSGPRWTSLGTYIPASRVSSTTGWRPSLMTISSPVFTWGRT